MSNRGYRPLSERELQSAWKKHKDIIDTFITNNQYDVRDIYIDKKNVLSIISKVDQRREYFRFYHRLDMSEYKEVALICFWYIKLKPIRVSLQHEDKRKEVEFDAINEKLALFYILSTYRTMLNKYNLPTDRLNSLPKEYLREIVYSFEYRDISKEALILLVESIAIFLGLEPYQKEDYSC